MRLGGGQEEPCHLCLPVHMGIYYTPVGTPVVLTEYSILVLLTRDVRSGADLLEPPARSVRRGDSCEWAEVRARRLGCEGAPLGCQ